MEVSVAPHNHSFVSVRGVTVGKLAVVVVTVCVGWWERGGYNSRLMKGRGFYSDGP